MARMLGIALAIVLFSLSTSHPAAADPIQITGGSFLVTGNFEVGPASLTGTRGFTLVGRVDSGESQIDAMAVCGQSEGCAPGARVSLTAVVSEEGWPGSVVTLDGKVYDDIDNLNSPASMFLHLGGEAFLPENPTEAFMLTAPFSIVNGVFHRSFPEQLVPVTGNGGTAVMSFVPGIVEEGRQRWVLDQIRYDFTGAAPVPEPGTMLLLSTGALLVARRVRRRIGRTAP
jgi:PEP-CTERM motif